MFRRELRCLSLQSGVHLTTFGFFILSVFCFSLALGPDETLLRRGAPAFLWVLAILTTLFSTPFLLKNEFQYGLLDEVFLHPSPPAFYILAKIGAESLFFGLPLILLGTLSSLFFSLSSTESATLFLTLLLSFPALSALGVLGGLLTLNTQGDGLLITLLILPLTLPLLLFALSGIELVRLGLDSSSSFCLLSGVSLLLTIICVTASSWALRFAVEG